MANSTNANGDVVRDPELVSDGMVMGSEVEVADTDVDEKLAELVGYTETYELVAYVGLAMADEEL